MITLEMVLAYAARTARNAFKEKGEVRPMWCGHTADDELVFVLPDSFATADHKDAAVAAARRIFKERGVVQFAFMTEAWMLESHAMTPEAFERGVKISRNESLEHHPDRREVITLQAEDRERCLLAHYFILRPEYGKPTLSPLVKPGGDGQMKASKGRMTHLLDDDVTVAKRSADPTR